MRDSNERGEMTDVAMSAPSMRTFARALFAGLLWGIGTATITAVAVASFAWATIETREALRLALETATWTAMVASILALFPIGPVAAGLGWLLHRRGIVSPWAYAGAGALSASVAPVLILSAAIETSRYPTTNVAILEEAAVLILVASFPIVGGFAGFMAGRILRRGAPP